MAATRIRLYKPINKASSRLLRRSGIYAGQYARRSAARMPHLLSFNVAQLSQILQFFVSLTHYTVISILKYKIIKYKIKQ